MLSSELKHPGGSQLQGQENMLMRVERLPFQEMANSKCSPEIEREFYHALL